MHINVAESLPFAGRYYLLWQVCISALFHKTKDKAAKQGVKNCNNRLRKKKIKMWKATSQAVLLSFSLQCTRLQFVRSWCALTHQSDHMAVYHPRYATIEVALWSSVPNFTTWRVTSTSAAASVKRVKMRSSWQTLRRFTQDHSLAELTHSLIKMLVSFSYRSVNENITKNICYTMFQTTLNEKKKKPILLPTSYFVS